VKRQVWFVWDEWHMPDSFPLLTNLPKYFNHESMFLFGEIVKRPVCQKGDEWPTADRVACGWIKTLTNI